MTRKCLNRNWKFRKQHLKTIAQELHDNIGQVLSVVKLSLAVLPLERGASGYTPLQHIRDVLNKAVYDLADLTKSLHTDRIAQIGLVESIRFDLETLAKNRFDGS